MSKKQKISFIFTALMLMIISIGCSDASNSGDGAEDPKGTVAISMKSQEYEFFVAQQESAEKKAEELGYKVKSSVADMDSGTQTNHFINYITESPDMILADPIDSSGLISAIERANADDIPVGIMDTPTNGGDVAFTVAFDNFEAGEMQAQEIINRLEEKNNEPKGLVLNAYGDLDSEAWRLRKEGFDKVMEDHPDIEVISSPGEGDIATTKKVTENAIAKHGDDIDAVAVPSDNPGNGIYQALKSADMLHEVGHPDHVIFVTIDGEPMALERIEEGYYDATISQDAIAYGEILVEFMDKYVLEGEPIPLETYENDNYAWKTATIEENEVGPRMNIPPYTIDKSNVDDEAHWGNAYK